MMRRFLVAGVLLAAAPYAAAEPTSKVYTFGTLKAPTVEAVRTKADGLLKDAPTRERAAAIWAQEGRALGERLADVLALAIPAAGVALADARNPATAAPTEMPAFFKDAQIDPFVKSNVALSYARALASKRVFEEALDALKLAVPEQVCDPAGYYFHKAVAEHALVQKVAAMGSISRLIDDVAEAPERYKMVGVLMVLDMQQWKDEEKDLENIARLMDNIERRLDLARGGPHTQELQKKVVRRLDEVIKEIENQIKSGNCNCQCPGGGGQQPGAGGPGPNPAPDSVPMATAGPGQVDPKKLKHLAENWGKMPDKERAKAMMDITKDLPPRYREVIEEYFKSLAKNQSP